MATLSVISVVGPGAAAAASLEATFASLVRQSVDSWEWLVVRVGNAAVGDVIAADSRVKLMNAAAA